MKYNTRSDFSHCKTLMTDKSNWLFIELVQLATFFLTHCRLTIIVRPDKHKHTYTEFYSEYIQSSIIRSSLLPPDNHHSSDVVYRRRGVSFKADDTRLHSPNAHKEQSHRPHANMPIIRQHELRKFVPWSWPMTVKLRVRVKIRYSITVRIITFMIRVGVRIELKVFIISPDGVLSAQSFRAVGLNCQSWGGYD